MKIHIDRPIQIYTIELITEGGKCYATNSWDTFEKLLCAILEHMGYVPFGAPHTEKYVLSMTDRAKDYLGEIHSNILEIIVKHHNSFV